MCIVCAGVAAGIGAVAVIRKIAKKTTWPKPSAGYPPPPKKLKKLKS